MARRKAPHGHGDAASAADDAVSMLVPETEAAADLARRHAELARRHAAELQLSDVLAERGGLSGLVRAASHLTGHCVWLLDTAQRVVAAATAGYRSDVSVPDLALLLHEHGRTELLSAQPVVIGPRPDRGIVRRHLVIPVARDGIRFGWLVVAELPGRFTASAPALTARVAFHLATEYDNQRRFARASLAARSSLARQLIRGSAQEDDLRSSADYLGVQVDCARVLVYLLAANGPGRLRDEEDLAACVARVLGVEVLVTRGGEGTVLLVEAPGAVSALVTVARVKQAVAGALRAAGVPATVVGVSTVAQAGSLRRAYREAREVARCVDRFASPATRMVAVDDLGPARLFLANSDEESIRRYVEDVLGVLLTDAPTGGDLLRTMHVFFDCDRSVRRSASALGVHENTVRLRLARVHDLTGLDVAGNANDQLAVQTALLVLRLQGHPGVPGFNDAGDVRHVGRDNARDAGAHPGGTVCARS